VADLVVTLAGTIPTRGDYNINGVHNGENAYEKAGGAFWIWFTSAVWVLSVNKDDGAPARYYQTSGADVEAGWGLGAQGANPAPTVELVGLEPINLTDTLVMAETFSATLKVPINLTDVMVLVDSATVALSGAIDVTDVLKMAETFSVMLRVPIDLTDALVLAETFEQPQLIVSIDLTDTLVLAETFAEPKLIVNINLIDTMTLTDLLVIRMGAAPVQVKWDWLRAATRRLS